MVKLLQNIFNSLIALIMWPIALAVFVVSAGIYMILILLVPPKKMHWLTRIVCRVILLGTGQVLKKKGKVPSANKGPHLYLFNHQSYLDPFILGATIKEYVSAVGGDFQFNWPLWGLIIKRYGAVPIIRENLKMAISSLSLVETEIKKGTSFLISPEGTRTTTGKMMPFKKGPFHVALNTGVTIIPVGIRGAWNSYRRYDWRIYPGVISVHYGKPIKFDKYKNMTLEDLKSTVYKKIAALCGESPTTPQAK